MRAQAVKADPSTVGCSYCGAGRGEPCIVTMSTQPEKPLSIRWFHRTREESRAR
jgi:hypothetical protein